MEFAFELGRIELETTFGLPFVLNIMPLEVRCELVLFWVGEEEEVAVAVVAAARELALRGKLR
jgi:hypothetical protein